MSKLNDIDIEEKGNEMDNLNSDVYSDKTESVKSDSMEMLKSNRGKLNTQEDIDHISSTLSDMTPSKVSQRSPKSRNNTVSRNYYLHPTESHIQTYKLYQAAKEHREDLEINKKQLKNRIALLTQEIEHAKRIRQELKHRHELSLKIQKEKNETRHELILQKERKQRQLAKQRKANLEKRAKHAQSLKLSKTKLQQAKLADAKQIYDQRKKYQEQIEKNKEKEIEQKMKHKYIVTKHKAEHREKKQAAKQQLLNNLRQEYVENVKQETTVIAKHEKAITKLETTEKQLYEQFLQMQKENENFVKNAQRRRTEEYNKFVEQHHK